MDLTGTEYFDVDKEMSWLRDEPTDAVREYNPLDGYVRKAKPKQSKPQPVAKQRIKRDEGKSMFDGKNINIFEHKWEHERKICNTIAIAVAQYYHVTVMELTAFRKNSRPSNARIVAITLMLNKGVSPIILARFWDVDKADIYRARTALFGYMNKDASLVLDYQTLTSNINNLLNA